MVYCSLKALYLKVILPTQRGTSSVGRASACQAEGRRFETGVPHHFINIKKVIIYKRNNKIPYFLSNMTVHNV